MAPMPAPTSTPPISKGCQPMCWRPSSDKATQEAILKASKTAEERGWKMWQDKAGWYLDQLKAKGMKVQAPSPELASGFKKAGETLTADWLKKAGADGQAIIDAYKKM